MIFRMISTVIIALAAAPPAHAFDLDATAGTPAAGADGTNGDSSPGARDTTYTFEFEAISLLNRIVVDFSEYGVGEGVGFDLDNVSEAPGQDVLATSLLDGLDLGLESVTVDNEAKRIVIMLDALVSVGDVRVTIADVQNPPCPGMGTIALSQDGLLGDDGAAAIAIASTPDADEDRLPDGFEVYYGAGGVRGDTDDNPAYKNAGLDPDVADDPSRDSDGDGFSDRREYLGCSNPADPASQPAATDSDGDGILDSDEGEPGEVVDTDGDGTPDSHDTDADGDGVSDADEAGDASPTTPPVDTDGDGVPDFQDTDADDDGVPDRDDNCNVAANPDQADRNRDGLGDACEDGTGPGGEIEFRGGGGCNAGGDGGSGAWLLLLLVALAHWRTPRPVTGRRARRSRT